MIKGKLTEDHTLLVRNHCTWIFKVTPEGRIIFNKEEFPGYSADDFAVEFIKFLESITLLRMQK